MFFSYNPHKKIKGVGKFVEFADVNKLKTKKTGIHKNKFSVPNKCICRTIRHLHTEKMRCHRKGDSALVFNCFESA